MRIAFVPAARLLSDREPNGESLIALDLVRAMAARGHEQLVYCERAELSAPIPGAEIVEVSASGPTTALGRIAFIDRIGRDLARRHREHRIDVAHLIFPCTSDEGYAPTLPSGVPLIVGPLNGSWQRAASSPRLAARAASLLPSALERRRHRATLLSAGSVLVATSAAARALPDHVRSRQIDCPFGVDLRRFVPAPLPTEPIIGTCSILSERKQIATLIDAMPSVRARIPAARLRIAGTDPHGLRASLEARAVERGAAGAIEFVGGLLPHEVPAFFNACRIAVQPSVGEPFGMTVLEAMACGRPVVACAEGGPADTILDGKTGRLVTSGDAASLADAIVALLAEPRGAERAGEAARRRVEQRFDLDEIVTRIEAAYAELTGRERVHAS